MEFSCNNVLSLLTRYRGRPYIMSGDTHRYRWVELLPDSPDDMHPDILYVCRLSEALQRNHMKPECHFVCICDRYLSDEEREDGELLKNTIVIEENHSIPWLLNLIQERFLELEKWEHEMKDVLLRDGDYQQIVDVSEKYLKNSLFVLDGAYRLIAYSKTYMSDDPINISLYKNGYHVQETLQRFYDYDCFSIYEKNPGVIQRPAGKAARYETLLKWLRYDGNPFLSVVEVFTHNPLTAESPELFDRMMRYINICFLREQKRNQNLDHSYSSFLRDMIYGELTDVQQIEGCAKRTGVPVSGDFDVYRIVFKDNGKVLIGRFAQELASLLNDAKIVIKDYEITVMNIYAKPNVKTLSERNTEYILPLLEKHGAELGISAPFHSLTELRHACAQAAHAIACGTRLHSSSLLAVEKHTNVYNYSDLFLFHMIHLSSSGSFNVFANNIYLQKLQMLADYDREHDTGLLRLLYLYLYYERRATEVGNRLHMHRNTVMYHVMHVRDLLDVDFDEYAVRQGLLIAFHYLQYGG